MSPWARLALTYRLPANLNLNLNWGGTAITINQCNTLAVAFPSFTVHVPISISLRRLGFQMTWTKTTPEIYSYPHVLPPSDSNWWFGQVAPLFFLYLCIISLLFGGVFAVLRQTAVNLLGTLYEISILGIWWMGSGPSKSYKKYMTFRYIYLGVYDFRFFSLDWTTLKLFSAISSSVTNEKEVAAISPTDVTDKLLR